MLVRLVVDRERDGARIEVGDAGAVRVGERDPEPRADGAAERRTVCPGDARNDEREPGCGEKASVRLIARGLRSIATIGSSASQLRVELLGEGSTIRPRTTAASSSDSVRSGAWSERWIATDLRPAPTCGPL